MGNMYCWERKGYCWDKKKLKQTEAKLSLGKAQISSCLAKPSIDLFAKQPSVYPRHYCMFPGGGYTLTHSGNQQMVIWRRTE